MSENAQRYSKREIQRRVRAAVSDPALNVRFEKRNHGQIHLTAKTALKGYVKWTAAIRRAMRPLAEQFGLKVIVDESRVIYHY